MNEIEYNGLYDGSLFYGDEEGGSRCKLISGLTQWISTSPQHLMYVVGVKGIGKSLLLRRCLDDISSDIVSCFFTRQSDRRRSEAWRDDATRFAKALAEAIRESLDEDEDLSEIQISSQLKLGEAIGSQEINEIIETLTQWIGKLIIRGIDLPGIVLVVEEEDFDLEIEGPIGIIAENRIKVIREGRRSSKPGTLGAAKAAAGIQRFVGPFWKTEARRFILGEHPSNKDEDNIYRYPPHLTSSGGEPNAVCDCAVRGVGCHPGLLATLASTLLELADLGPALDGEEALLSALMHDESHGNRIKTSIGTLVDAIKADSRELYAYLVQLAFGLRDPEPARCKHLQRSYALIYHDSGEGSEGHWEIPELVREIVTGGEEMELPTLIAVYARSRARKFVAGKLETPLKELWEGLFPPTPLYIAALQESAKEVKSSWPVNDLPDNIAFVLNALGDLQIANVDLKKAQALSSVSEAQIKAALVKHIGASEENVKRFIRQVVDVAEEKYRKAIIFQDREGAAPLWRQWILRTVEQLGTAVEDEREKQTEILQRLIKIDGRLAAWFPKSDGLETLDEVYPIAKTESIKELIRREAKAREAKAIEDGHLIDRMWLLNEIERRRERLDVLYQRLDIHDIKAYAADLKYDVLEDDKALTNRNKRHGSVDAMEQGIRQTILQMYALANLLDET